MAIKFTIISYQTIKVESNSNETRDVRLQGRDGLQDACRTLNQTVPRKQPSQIALIPRLAL